jgi:hypothetical protein
VPSAAVVVCASAVPERETVTPATDSPVTTPCSVYVLKSTTSGAAAYIQHPWPAPYTSPAIAVYSPRAASQPHTSPSPSVGSRW